MSAWSSSTLALLILAAAPLLKADTAGNVQTDPATGLAVGQGWELARAHCGACHSYRLVTSQGGDEAFWLRTIRWMQAEQNLWPIPSKQEEELVRYLATYYPSGDWGRRAPLPQRLMP